MNSLAEWILGDLLSDVFTAEPFPGLDITRLVERRVLHAGPSKWSVRDLRFLCVSCSMAEVGSESSSIFCSIVFARVIEVKSALAVSSNLRIRFFARSLNSSVMKGWHQRRGTLGARSKFPLSATSSAATREVAATSGFRFTLSSAPSYRDWRGLGSDRWKQRSSDDAFRIPNFSESTSFNLSKARLHNLTYFP